MFIRGSLDTVTTKGVQGWAWSPDAQGGLIVQALLNHQVIGEGVASRYRPDLAEVGIGDGACGYEITFSHSISADYLPFVVVKPVGGDVEMPRSSLSGYREFFAAMFRDWPATGRHRCLLGGLWTDRGDASAMLRARVELGTIAAGVGETVSMMLALGLMQPRLDAPVGEGTVPAKAIGTALETASVIAALRAVLEDNPVVLSPAFAVDTPFRQPSGIETLASPAECVALVLPLGDAAVDAEVIRDSHLLPEFDDAGRSRWVSRTGHPALAMAEAYGMLDRYALPADRLTVIGPGLLHRLLAPNQGAVFAIALPARAAPLRRLLRAESEIVCASGARIWL